MPPKKGPPSRDVDVDGVTCHVTKYPNRTYVVIGTEASNRGTFNLKDAEWTDDEAIRAQARARSSQALRHLERPHRPQHRLSSRLTIQVRWSA